MERDVGNYMVAPSGFTQTGVRVGEDGEGDGECDCIKQK